MYECPAVAELPAQMIYLYLQYAIGPTDLCLSCCTREIASTSFHFLERVMCCVLDQSTSFRVALQPLLHLGRGTLCTCSGNFDSMEEGKEGANVQHTHLITYKQIICAGHSPIAGHSHTVHHYAIESIIKR